MGRTSSEAKNKYNAKAYDRITLVVPKGCKGQIQDYAAQRGESVNALLNRLLAEAMQKDGIRYQWPPKKEKE